MRRLAIITSRFPIGPFEAFLHDEIEELGKTFDVMVFPGIPGMLSFGVVLQAFAEFLRDPFTVTRLFYDVVTAPRGFLARMKNAAIFPKALAVAREMRERRIEHVHAYWLSAPATIAYVAAKLNGIPWSATGHRYDVVNHNLSSTGTLCAGFLPQAQFIRTISERGHRQVFLAAGNRHIHTIHLGVRLPRCNQGPKVPASPLRLVCIANFDRVKGHDVLFHALRIAKSTGTRAVCTLAGLGRARKRLERLARTLEIEDIVRFAGSIPRPQLLQELENGDYDAAILTSIDEGWQQSEGIPVALMEAMAAGLPCIATTSGSVGELVDASNGIPLEPGDVRGIARAIRTLSRNDVLYARLGMAAHERIAREFCVVETARRLGDLLHA